MENNNKKVSVEIFDPENQCLYRISLNSDDARRCENDVLYAQTILDEIKRDYPETNNSDVLSETSQVYENNNCLPATPNPIEKSTWAYNETLALITAYENNKENFNVVKKRKSVWDNISNELISQGFERSSSNCEIKWKNLIRTYKNVKDLKKQTGRGSNRFLFFEKIDEIIGQKPSISCSNTFSSSTVEAPSTSFAYNTELNTSVVEDVCTNDTFVGQQPAEICGEETGHNPTGNSITVKQKKKKERITDEKLKKKTEELLDMKINYYKNKQETQAAKEKRKEERIVLQRKMLEMEEKKLLLFQKYVERENNKED